MRAKSLSSWGGAGSDKRTLCNTVLGLLADVRHRAHPLERPSVLTKMAEIIILSGQAMESAF
jgi:hypothetical protein